MGNRLFSNKKLLIVSHVAVSGYGGRYYLQGGFGRHLDAYAEWFGDVYLLTCFSSVGRDPGEYCLKSKNVFILPIVDFWGSVGLKRYFLIFAAVLQVVIKSLFWFFWVDVVHFRLPSFTAGASALFLKLSRKPVFFYIAGDWGEKIRRKGLGSFGVFLSWVVDSVLRFIVGRKLCFVAGKDLYYKFRDSQNGNIFVVPATAIDRVHIVSPEVAVEKVSSTPREILFVGSVSEMKGIYFLLEALSILRGMGKDMRLKVIGQVSDSKFSKKICSLGLEGLVSYYPHMSWEKLIFEYDQSDIFILPSLSEGVPKVLVEAMARGLPVVATRVGGVSSLIIDHKNGLLINPCSSFEIVKAVLLLLEDVSLRKKLVLGGLRTANRLTLTKLINRILSEVYLHYFS